MTVYDASDFPWYITSISMFLTGFIGPVIMITIYEKLTKIHNRAFDLILGVK